MLSISQAQLDQFQAASFESFEDRCADFVAEHFPDYPAVFGDAGVRQRIRVEMQRADLRGVTTERGMLQYLYLSLMLGNGFDLSPGYAWVAAILEKDGSPDARVSEALDAVVERVEREQPLEGGA